MLKNRSVNPSNELSRIIEGPKGAEQSDAPTSDCKEELLSKQDNNFAGQDNHLASMEHKATGGVDGEECLDYDKHRFLDESMNIPNSKDRDVKTQDENRPFRHRRGLSNDETNMNSSFHQQGRPALKKVVEPNSAVDLVSTKDLRESKGYKKGMEKLSDLLSFEGGPDNLLNHHFIEQSNFLSNAVSESMSNNNGKL